MKKTSRKNQHVAVIGAGIVGVCCALNLQRQGFDVTLLDKDGVAQGCSKGNAGHFATEQIFPLADKSLLSDLPKILFNPSGPLKIKLSYFLNILPWLVRFILNMRPSMAKRNTAALTSLNEAAIEAYDDLLKHTGLSNNLLKKGSLLTFENTQNKDIEITKRKYLDGGVNVEWLNKSQLRELEPSISDVITSALYFPDVGHTEDPEQFCISLFDQFVLNHGKLVNANVDSIKQVNNEVLIKTEESILHFDKVVVAAGAWSKKLVKNLGYKIPLDTERGYHLMLETHPALGRPIASFERKMIMTPMKHGLRLAGIVEFAGFNPKKNKNCAKILFENGTKIIDGIDSNSRDVEKMWMGLRPSFPDSLPVICQAPNHDCIYFAFGHQHLGLTQAAITGKLVASLTSSTPTCVDVTPFCISRFK